MEDERKERQEVLSANIKSVSCLSDKDSLLSRVFVTYVKNSRETTWNRDTSQEEKTSETRRVLHKRTQPDSMSFFPDRIQ